MAHKLFSIAWIRDL